MFSLHFLDFGPRWCPWDLASRLLSAFCSSVFSPVSPAHINLLLTLIRYARWEPNWSRQPGTRVTSCIPCSTQTSMGKRKECPSPLTWHVRYHFQLGFSHGICRGLESTVIWMSQAQWTCSPHGLDYGKLNTMQVHVLFQAGTSTRKEQNTNLRERESSIFENVVIQPK